MKSGSVKWKLWTFSHWRFILKAAVCKALNQILNIKQNYGGTTDFDFGTLFSSNYLGIFFLFEKMTSEQILDIYETQWKVTSIHHLHQWEMIGKFSWFYWNIIEDFEEVWIILSTYNIYLLGEIH